MSIAIVLWQLTDISDDGYLCLMADNGELREDLKIPDGDLGTQLRADFESGKELLVSMPLYNMYMNIPWHFCILQYIFKLQYYLESNCECVILLHEDI